MSKEVNFFTPEYVSTKTKFYRYMDSLISHKSDSKTECILLITISYIQLISGFFCKQVGILKDEESPDNYFILLQRVIRIHDLFSDSFQIYTILLYIIFILLIILTFLFLRRVRRTGKVASYSFYEIIINFFLKIFLYILYQPILDFCLSLLCLGDKNPHFSDETAKCNVDDIFLFIIMILIFLYTIFLALFLSLFYNESFLLSNSPISRINTNYELYLNINAFIFSIILNFTYSIGNIIFILYNTIMSIVLLNYYLSSRPFYDYAISYLIGFFHMLYAWTSLFTLFFYFIRVYQVSIVYISILLILLWMYYNMHQTMSDEITLNKPFHQLSDKFTVLYYIRYIIDKYKTIETNLSDKAKIIGIIFLHKRECPLPDCPSKFKKKKFYLPITDEWSNPNKMEFNDRVYLQNFIIFIYDYFLSKNFFDNDILINLSMYYLQTIGNFCKSMQYHQKAGDNTMNIQEKLMHFRAGEQISKALIKACRPSNEIASNLEYVNFSQYFKYQNLAEKLKVNIIRDVHLCKEFWKLLVTKDLKRKILDFNEIFELTDKVRLTKQTIDKLWDDIIGTYNGYNDLFELYENYVESINDDSLTLRELLKIKTKNFAMEGIFNYYNTLFSNDTCIIICSGDKNKEGTIEKVSSNITDFFGYKEEEVKGINIGALMPKMFEKDHTGFMKKYIEIGEKKVVDKTFRTYAKDKDNSLIVINLSIKLFPILGENIFFCAMMTREEIEDIILLDGEYNIQIMSRKLYDIFGLNSELFQDVDIPFWMICREFIRHFQTFMMNNSKVKNFSQKKNMKNNNNNEGYVAQNKDKNVDGKSEISNDAHSKDENNKMEVTELDFEINENAEVEWEMTIPNYLRTFQNNFMTAKTMSFKTIQHNNTHFINNSFNNSKLTEKMDDNQQDDDQDETSHLIKKPYTEIKPSKFKPDKSVSINEETNKENINKNNTHNNNIIHKTFTNNNNNNNNYMSTDQLKSFQNEITKYRNLFLSGNKQNIAELIQLLDKKKSFGDKTYKFIVSFNQLNYGDKKVAYIIRCIDNKEGTDSKSSGHEKEKKIAGNTTTDLDLNEQRKKHFDKIYYLKDMNEIIKKTEIQVLRMRNNIEQLDFLASGNNKIRDLIDNYHKEILKFSRVLGINIVNVFEDGGSQASSQSDYTNSITKKTRIQEIKSHIMKNVNNFYTLILIKFLFILFMLGTIVIGIICIIKFGSLLSSIEEVDLLHSNTLKLGFNFLYFLERINSFVALSKIRNDLNDSITYKLYLDYKQDNNSNNLKNRDDAYDYYIKSEKVNFDSLIQELEDLSYNVMFYFSDSISDFSQREYYFQFIPYYKGMDAESGGEISFPLSIELYSSILFRIGKTQKLYFPYKFPEDDVDNSVKNVTEYLSFIALDNPYLTVIPYLLDLLTNNTRVCSDENNKGGFDIYIIIIIYSVITVIFAGIYSFFLYLTNKNMEEGMLKLTKIDPRLIGETIKTIDFFNRNALSLYIELTDKENNNNNKKKSKTKKEKEKKKEKENKEKDNNEEEKIKNKKSKKLKSLKTMAKEDNKINDNDKNKDVKSSRNNNINNGNNNNKIKDDINSKKKKNKKEVEEAMGYYDVSAHKKLKILTLSYFQSLILILIFTIFLIILIIRLKNFLSNIKELLLTKEFFSYDHIVEILNLLNMKIFMSQRITDQRNFSLFSNYVKDSEDKVINIYNQISKHKILNDFYENKYISSICSVLYEESNNNYNLCKNDNVIGTSSNVDEVKHIFEQKLENIWRDYNLSEQNENYTSFYEFSTESYGELEYISTEYFHKIIDKYCEVIEESRKQYGSQEEGNIKMIVIVMIIFLWIFCLYVIFIYVNNLVHLLLISRCIFKIIPTRVINQTKDLEDWIDDKY